MKKDLMEVLTSSSSLTIEQVVLNIIMAAALGFLIYIAYAVSHRGTIYSKKFNTSLVLLSTLTGVVMTVIGNNIALSLGMVGALSIVRFRTAIKDSRDTVFIFWAIVVGISCGAGDYVVAAVGSGIAFVVLLIFGVIKNDNRMLLIVRGHRTIETNVQSVMYQTFHNKARLRVKNTTAETIEFIYETTEKAVEEVRLRGESLSDMLYRAGQVDYVNIVMQNDEISN